MFILSEQNLMSRFFNENDKQETNIFYELHDGWWSRKCEYVWAGSLVLEEDVILDSACGVCHPFKFYLTDKAKQVFACDLDKNVSNLKYIKQEIIRHVAEEQSKVIQQSDIDKVKFDVCDITKMPYENKMFDKVFNISVLEHIDRNKRLDTMKEFYRVLKDYGMLIMTCNHPDVTIEEMKE